MTIKRNNFQFILNNFKQFTCHKFVIVVISNGKDCLSDHFLQCELGNHDCIIFFNVWKI